MTKQDIIDILRKNIIEIIPELEREELPLNDRLVDLGLNSIDRGELITLTLEELELEVPRVEFVKADTIDELAALFIKKQNG